MMMRALVEALSMFALIMLYIWALREEHSWLWLVLLALVLSTHWVHGENPRELGFGLATFPAAARSVFPWVLLLAGAIWAGGALAGTLRDVDLEQTTLGVLGYSAWGLFQQYLLNGYFANRLAEYKGDSKGNFVPLVAALLFSLAHLPNWLLMGVTFAGGYACVRVYLRYRNLYMLAIAHGVVGFFLFLAVPDSISSHFRVGPR